MARSHVWGMLLVVQLIVLLVIEAWVPFQQRIFAETASGRHLLGSAVSCRSDSDCQDDGADRLCVFSESLSRSVCAHKPLQPVSSGDVWGSLLVTLSAAAAAGGGLGGGGLYVPLFVLVSGFVTHEAVPISKVMIFGGSIANFLVNAPKRHPLAPHRWLIDYDISLMLEPLTLGGAVMGVILNTMFPQWLILALLVVLLGVTTYQTYQKGMSLYQKETTALKEDEESTLHVSDREVPLLPTRNESDTDATTLREIIAYENGYPVNQLALLSVVWMGVLILALMKGGSGAPSIMGFEPCSGGYWLSVFGVLPLVVYVTYDCGKYLHERYIVKRRVGYNFVAGDIQWTWNEIVGVPSICFGAGIIAGLMGIGGGMVKSPLLLFLGVNPTVSSATSSFMILFTASCTTLQYIILGLVPFDYGVLYFVLGFLGTYVGQVGLNYLVKKYKKDSYIVFGVAFVIALSTVLLTYTGLQKVMRERATGADMGFKGPC